MSRKRLVCDHCDKAVEKSKNEATPAGWVFMAVSVAGDDGYGAEVEAELCSMSCAAAWLFAQNWPATQ